MSLLWDNFKTGKVETFDFESDERALEFIPQHPAAQNMYTAYRALGLNMQAAMINVLSVCAGDEAPFPIKPDLS